MGFIVTFWHETCLLSIERLKTSIMNDLTKKYELAKSNSKKFMQNGQLGAYVNALLEMNKYKKLMMITVAN